MTTAITPHAKHEGLANLASRFVSVTQLPWEETDFEGITVKTLLLDKETGLLTVLMRMAMYHDWPKAAEAVIERGCDVNATNRDGWTALHFAGWKNRRGTARVLLERGADRTIKSNQGGTASDTARNNGHAFLAELIDNYKPKPGSVAAVAQARRDAEAKRRAAALGLVNGGRCAQCAADCVVS